LIFMDHAGQEQDSATTDPHPAALDPERLARDCDFRATRRSGPGGQNRNKVETAVVLTHRPTGVKAQASERRTQGENRRVALLRVRLELALTIRRPINNCALRPYSPTELWRRRCRGGRIDVNPEHEDFPALLAEALDVLYAIEDDPKAGALLLGCSPSQLIKFLKESPRAWGLINERRRTAGRHPLV
jgi:RF-1 domain